MQVVEANVVRGKDYGFVHLSAGLDLAWLDQVQGNITHMASLCGLVIAPASSLTCHPRCYWARGHGSTETCST